MVLHITIYIRLNLKIFSAFSFQSPYSKMIIELTLIQRISHSVIIPRFKTIFCSPVVGGHHVDGQIHMYVSYSLFSLLHNNKFCLYF